MARRAGGRVARSLVASASLPLLVWEGRKERERERRAKSTLGTRKTHPLYIRPDFTSGGGIAASVDIGGAAAGGSAGGGAGGGAGGASCVSFERHAIAPGRMNGAVMHTCITGYTSGLFRLPRSAGRMLCSAVVISSLLGYTCKSEP